MSLALPAEFSLDRGEILKERVLYFAGNILGIKSSLSEDPSFHFQVRFDCKGSDGSFLTQDKLQQLSDF